MPWILGSRPLFGASRETGGRSAEVCLDAVSGPMFPVALESLAIGGRLAVIVAKGDGNIAFNLRDFYHRGLRMMGIDSLQSSAERVRPFTVNCCPCLNRGR